MSLESICNQLRDKRIELGLSQEALARRIGLSLPVLRAIEKDPHWGLKIISLIRYCSGLGMSAGSYVEALQTIWEQTRKGNKMDSS